MKERMLFYLDNNIEVTRRTTLTAGPAFTNQLEPGSGFHPGRNFHGKTLLLTQTTGTITFLTGVFDDRALSPTGRTGLTNTEKTLLVAHLAMPFTGRTDLRLGPGFKPCSLTEIAGNMARNFNLGLGAEDRLVKLYIQIIAQAFTGPSGRTSPTAGSAKYFTKKIAKNIPKTTKTIKVKTGATLLLQTFMTILVVKRSFLPIG